MNKTQLVVAAACLLIGYLLGNFLPLNNLSSPNSLIETSNNNQATSLVAGQGLLAVTVTNNLGEPMVGIEIDVGVRPGGPPESWGVKEADPNGQASYNLEPGTYYVYFNLNRFPAGYEPQPEQLVVVEEGQTSQVNIVLQKK